MELHFLGTGAGVPSKARNVFAVALTFSGHGGKVWLFDCGEGTQHQILRSPIKLSKLEKLFITHLHGDHIFGIPGLLGSRSFQGGKHPLTIYGPHGIRHFIETALRVSETHLPYELSIVEVSDGAIIEENGMTITVAELDHAIPSFGFRIVEPELPGKLQADRLQALGIPPGELYGRIKQGETVRLSDGRTIDGQEFLGSPQRGRIVSILGDTRYCAEAVQLAANADVLVHEATYAEPETHLAERYGHSTAAQAAITARQADASRLILTHISPRYDAYEERLLDEARKIFSQTMIARDLWSYPIPRLV